MYGPVWWTLGLCIHVLYDGSSGKSGMLLLMLLLIMVLMRQRVSSLALLEKRVGIVWRAFHNVPSQHLIFNIDDNLAAPREMRVWRRWLFELGETSWSALLIQYLLLLKAFYLEPRFVPLIVNPRKYQHVQNQQTASDRDRHAQSCRVRGIPGCIQIGQGVYTGVINVLQIRGLNVTDTRGGIVIRGCRRLGGYVLPFEFLADSAQGIRPHRTVVEAGIRVSSEQVVPRINVFHSGSMKFWDEAKPDG